MKKKFSKSYFGKRVSNLTGWLEMSGVVIGCLPDPPPPPPKADAFLTIPSLTFALTTEGDTFLMATGAGAVGAGGFAASVSEEEVEEVEEVEGCLPNRGGGGERTEEEGEEEVGVLEVVEGGDTIPGRKMKILYIFHLFCRNSRK